MMIQPLDTRAIEWTFAFLALGWGASLLFPGSMLSGSTYAPLLVVATEQTWGVFTVLMSCSRIIALWINGYWRRTPIFRMIFCLFSASWLWLLFILYGIGFWNGADQFPMWYGWLALVIAELVAAANCGRDAAIYNSFRFVFLSNCKAWFLDRLALGNRSGPNVRT